MRTKFNSFAIANPRCTFTCRNSSRSVYSVAPWRPKPPIFAIFWTSVFNGVASWRQSEKVEHACTTTNLPLSKGVKIVSVLQRLHGEIGRKISDLQKRDEQSNKQTDRQTDKNSTFLAAQAAGEIRAPPTWHGDRRPRARSCTSKTFGGLTHSFAARGC